MTPPRPTELGRNGDLEDLIKDKMSEISSQIREVLKEIGAEGKALIEVISQVRELTRRVGDVEAEAKVINRIDASVGSIVGRLAAMEAEFKKRLDRMEEEFTTLGGSMRDVVSLASRIGKVESIQESRAALVNDFYLVQNNVAALKESTKDLSTIRLQVAQLVEAGKDYSKARLGVMMAVVSLVFSILGGITVKYIMG